jgi:hypothetical protein
MDPTFATRIPVYEGCLQFPSELGSFRYKRSLDFEKLKYKLIKFIEYAAGQPA